MANPREQALDAVRSAQGSLGGEDGLFSVPFEVDAEKSTEAPTVVDFPVKKSSAEPGSRKKSGAPARRRPPGIRLPGESGSSSPPVRSEVPVLSGDGFSESASSVDAGLALTWGDLRMTPFSAALQVFGMGFLFVTWEYALGSDGLASVLPLRNFALGLQSLTSYVLFAGCAASLFYFGYYANSFRRIVSGLQLTVFVLMGYVLSVSFVDFFGF